jgi:CheY-like chemotaxis protein
VGSTFAFFITACRSDPPRVTQLEGAMPVGPYLGEEISVSHRLPMQKQDIDAVVSPAGLVAAQTGAAFNPEALAILVVEDNLINQKVLVKQLRQVGSTVDVANDGIEALAFLEKTHYRIKGGVDLSIILMDLEMPNMDGLACVREIRKMEEHGKIAGHVPVIAVTANVRDEQIKAAMSSGMDDVVSVALMPLFEH